MNPPWPEGVMEFFFGILTSQKSKHEPVHTVLMCSVMVSSEVHHKLTVADLFCWFLGVKYSHTNILCVKMLRENGVPAADLRGMKGGKAGQGTWNVDLPVSEIDIKNMTTSQMMSLRTMPHTDMSGFYHCVPNETHTGIFV